MRHLFNLIGQNWLTLREQREVAFAAQNNAQGGAQPEKEKQTPSGGRSETEPVKEMSEGFREMLTSVAPELSANREELLRSEELATYAGFDAEDEAKILAREWHLPISQAWENGLESWKNAVPPEEHDRMQQELDRRREAAMQHALQDPSAVRGLLTDVDQRIERADELSESLERAIKLETDTLTPDLTAQEQEALRGEMDQRRKLLAHIPAQEIATLLLAEIPQLDREAISSSLRLEERIPDPLQRARVLTTILDAINPATKLQNFGRGFHKDDLTNNETWTAWKRDYVGELQQQRATLLEQLHGLLEQRYESFIRAEGERLLAITRSLNLTENDVRRIQDGDPAAFEEGECRALQRYGVGLSALCRRTNERALAASAIDDLVQQKSGEERLSSPKDPNFLARADQMLQTMTQLESDTERLDPALDNFAADLQREQEETEEQAAALARRVRALRGKTAQAAPLPGIGDPNAMLEAIDAEIGKYADAPDPSIFRKDYPACVTPERMTSDAWKRMESVVVLLERAGTTIHGQGAAIDEYLRRSAEETPLATIEGNQLSTRVKIGALLEGIIPALDAPICRTLHLDRTLQEKASHLEGLTMRAAASAEKAGYVTDPGQQKELTIAARTDWTQVQMEIEQLEKLQAQLSDLKPENAVFEPDEAFPSENEQGFFDLHDRKIHLRNALREPDNEQRRKTAWLHEKGHATLHLLRESGVLPFFLLAEEHDLAAHLQQSEGTSFDELLKQLTEYYHIDALRGEFQAWGQEHFPNDPVLAAEDAKKIEREHLLEELFSRFADARDLPRNAIAEDDPKREQKQAEQRLFDLLRAGDVPQSAMETRPGKTLRSGRLYTNGTPDADATDSPEQGTSLESVETSLIKKTLMDTDSNLRIISSFIDAYKDTTKPAVRAFIEENAPQIAAMREELESLDEQFRAQEPVSLQEVDRLKATSKEILEKVRDFDREFWDIRFEKKAKKETLWDKFRFMSVYDVIKLWKDTMEDFKSIYTRNQQRLLQDVGNALNDALTNAGGKIPIIGPRYFAKLRGYHERRYADAELDGVGKWKKAMEKLDTHQILHILGNTGNFDQIRGCIEMVCDRGEMDWNDVGVWKTLMKTSGYNMPIQACLRDDILRDTWLRKMISATWKDMELFYKWRSNNDSNTESQKRKFVQQVDQYSNVSGGLAGNLERQLRLFKQWKATEKENKLHGLPPPPFPDDIKPHLYEEVIEYSIKNGKMSMEQKMYYIVQGVASQLLPIERLRALAGQHGSIIQIFPYIEYFYGHNNSLPEIEALARRLTEADGQGNPTFKPGLKTTLWIHLEVSRDEQVRRRLSKGSTRKAEDIDHEDIPFFVTQMDYSEMSNMLDVISGGRQKVTPEGLKNAYVGFNSKMRIFGNLAKMEQDHLERFTEDDASTAAKNLAAYIFMDNSITMNGKANNRRPPTLSLSQFHTQAPSVPNAETAWEYRQKMTRFIQALDRAGIFNSIKWEGDQASDRDALGVKKTAMLAIDTKDTEREGYQRNSQADYDRILSDSVFPRFAQQLEKAIRANLPAFKKVLAECEGLFLNEGGSEDLAYAKVKAIKEAEWRTAAQAQMGSAA